MDPDAETTINGVATAYNQAGDRYLAYADGDPQHPFSFDRLHGYADRYVWAVLEAKLIQRRSTGACSIRLLDAGCGPGTWLRRMIIRANALGFTDITARGFDVAEAQIRRARVGTRDLARLPNVRLSFEVADLTAPLSEGDDTVDIATCLYSVLSHLPLERLPAIANEFARVTAGNLVATVRPVGSTPSLLVDSMDKARHLQLDHQHDRCHIELIDGRKVAFRFHLFTATEFRATFAKHFVVEDLRGLDLFHSRFAPDPRWNPPGKNCDSRFSGHLAQLEEACATRPEFLDRAAHLLFVGSRAHGKKRGAALRPAMPAPSHPALTAARRPTFPPKPDSPAEQRGGGSL